MTYLERLNDFFAYAHVNRLCASAQLVYLTLLDRWNSLRRPLSFVCSINEISRLSCLSTSRVADALHNLTSRHLLKIVKTGKQTEYFLPEGQLPTGIVDRTLSATKRQGALPLESKNTNSLSTERQKEAVASGNDRGGLINVSYTINELKAKWQRERDNISDDERERVRQKAAEYMARLRNSSIAE